MKKFITILALGTLTACASTTADSYQGIAITTTPPGALCTAKNDAGQSSLAQTPGTISVKRAFAPLTIQCAKRGYATAQITLEAQTRNRAFGNILLGGVPALADAYTGDGYEYAPAEVVLKLTKK